MVSFLETQSLSLFFEIDRVSRGMFCAEFAPLPCMTPRPPPLAEAAGAAQTPPRQRERSELEGLVAGAWLSIPVSSLLNIYSEMYQMLHRKGFVSFQVPRCSCRRGH